MRTHTFLTIGRLEARGTVKDPNMDNVMATEL